MNMRKAAAAAFGAALLGAGTGAVLTSGPAHGVLSSNSTGKATNKNSASGGPAEATCLDCSVSIDAPFTATAVAGIHHNGGRISQHQHNKTKGGNASASTKGSAKSGSQRFRVH